MRGKANTQEGGDTRVQREPGKVVPAAISTQLLVSGFWGASSWFVSKLVCEDITMTPSSLEPTFPEVARCLLFLASFFLQVIALRVGHHVPEVKSWLTTRD